MLSAATNKLEEFLALEDESKGCSIKYVDGAMTWLSDFKAMFEAKRHGLVVKYVEDMAVFQAHGFRLSSTRVNVCRSCKRPARVDCCDESARDNKTMRDIIYNMELVHVTKMIET